MAALYPGTTVSGYNANPPPDDGTKTVADLITWAGIKSKIGDPLNTFSTTVDANLTAAFARTLDGASVVSTGVTYNMTAADQGRLIKATAAITINLPDATGVSAPFSFAVNNQSAGVITLDGFGTQTIDGQITQVIQPGGGCIVKTDGNNWFSFGLAAAQTSVSGSAHGFDAPINCGLVASVASNILTVALKTKAGNDPSPGDPALVPFRDATLANGDPVFLSITTPSSITTNAVGATLGTQNGVPFRFWVLLFNNGGVPVLALWHSGAGSSPPAINPLNEAALPSTTGISAGSAVAGIFYTPNGVSLANSPFRILGFLDYAAGLATAGTYNIPPTTLQLFGPGVKKPGDIVQTRYQTSIVGQIINTGTLTITALTTTITPSSSPNAILAEAYAVGKTAIINNGGADINQQIARSNAATAPSNLFGNVADVGTSQSGVGAGSGTLSNKGLDVPGAAASTPYSVYIYSTGGSATWLGTLSGANNQMATFLLTEIMA